MGSSHSVRASHFQRPNQNKIQSMEEPTHEPETPSEEHHISISNKMVERLVEDATLAGGAVAAVASTVAHKPPRGDFKEKIFIEKLRNLDDTHTERLGLTMDELTALARRIEMRADSIVGLEPVCENCAQKVIECYTSTSTSSGTGTGQPDDALKCWDTVGAFSKCVQDASAVRLRARTQQKARETALRSRNMQLAREHALKDLGPPPLQPTPT